MRKLVISLIIGIIAGIIDLVPMLLMELDWRACTSAFIQWVVLGIFINYIDFKIMSWLKGLIVAEMASIPILFIVSNDGINSILPIIIMSAILGSLVGYTGMRFAK
jgi:hypothetical protein